MTETIKVEFHDQTEEAKKKVNDLLASVMADIFQDDILPDAKAMSPVGDEPVRPGSKRNRDSLEVGVFKMKKGGVLAKIYSTSGHGGFLEAGTKKMAAQPYVYPAVQRHLPKIEQQLKEQAQAVEDSTNFHGS